MLLLILGFISVALLLPILLLISVLISGKCFCLCLFLIPCLGLIIKRECMGIEPTLYSPDNTVVSNLGVSESGSLEVLGLWPHLTPSQIEAILRIVWEGT